MQSPSASSAAAFPDAVSAATKAASRRAWACSACAIARSAAAWLCHAARNSTTRVAAAWTKRERSCSSVRPTCARRAAKAAAREKGLAFCVDALEDALDRHGSPEIFNTDQGAQFTSDDFTQVLKSHGIRISMDGKGPWRDDVFVERLCQSEKYEEVYLHTYDSASSARAGLLLPVLQWPQPPHEF